MITGLPDSHRNDALLVIVNRFSKAIIPITCNVELLAKGWARILRDHFVSKFMKELYRMLDITANTSTTFHPQTDGQMEQVNQEIEKYLWIFINYRQDNWSDWLPLVEFTHNNRVHNSVRPSPFTSPATMEFIKTTAKIHKETESALKEAAGRMEKQYNKRKRNAIDYQIGDHIWLDATNLHLPRPKKKLNDKRVGLFEILEKAGASIYKLKLPPHWKVHPCFNKKLLTPYTLPAFPNQEEPSPPPRPH
ncbi:uncharacterized protein ARMOST_13835 [Armillaria ostoyae]|uniref:Tf2-1-like SH3-like domain-containing protein n=1 Tax=Armillaria ostoyae TaxID=47428 RepID=A0A284RNW9_ARMOS|nr:uncharacterized protein ARMOST_13835 [Armillaria ostoyae]